LEDVNAKKEKLEDEKGISEKQIKAVGEILENVRKKWTVLVIHSI
jgi:DNA-binding HxlR family transcriptional regulator